MTATSAPSLNLAPIEAIDGHVQESLALLHLVAEAGVERAPAYASIIDRTATDVQIRSVETAANSGDTDALNFLGLVAFIDGRTGAARGYWSRSADAGDSSAPVLLSRINKAEAK